MKLFRRTPRTSISDSDASHALKDDPKVNHTIFRAKKPLDSPGGVALLHSGQGSSHLRVDFHTPSPIFRR
eukprot:1349430-Amorphochlora_amoeboformis.AAC.1